jgi:hypothetical protein
MGSTFPHCATVRHATLRTYLVERLDRNRHERAGIHTCLPRVPHTIDEHHFTSVQEPY